MPSASYIRWITVLACVVKLAGLAGETAKVQDPRYWPQWRGPLMTGFAPEADPPVEWSEDKNVKWKTALPGLGHSTPVVWGDRVFLTASRPVGEPLEEPIADGAPGSHDNLYVKSRHQFLVIAADRRNGKILWEQPVHEALPHAGGHVSGSLASHSPCADGEHVIAFFGSFGLYCLTPDGQEVWRKGLGRMQSKHGHGEGSTPVLFGETVVVNWDHEDQSFIAAFDKTSGEERWRKSRDEATSWASPIVAEHQGRRQVIVSGTQRLRAYDLETGDLVWECGGLSANVVASPVAGSGVVVAGSSYDTQAMFAVKLDGAKGDVTDTSQVLWRRKRSTPYVPSPLLSGNAVYFLRHYQNILSRVDLHTGEDRGGPWRLGQLGNIYSSPVGAAGRVYVTSREGVTTVLSDGEKPELLGLNRLDDVFSASAALVGKQMLLRGENYLYCLEDESAEGALESESAN